MTVEDASPIPSAPSESVVEEEIVTKDIAPAAVSVAQICMGAVIRYAPSLSPSSASSDSHIAGEEGLYETLWQDGATLYYGESAYQNARILYEKMSLMKAAEADRSIKSEADDSKKRKTAEVDADEKEKEEDGVDDEDDSEDEDVGAEGGELKRMKSDSDTVGGTSASVQVPVQKDTMLMRSKYSVPFETVLKWR